MTADERKAAFLADFKALLRKHDAEFEMPRYSDASAEVYMRGRYTEGGEVIDADVSFDLPPFENGKE